MPARILAALAIALLLAGCGGSDEGGGDEPKQDGSAAGFTAYTVESSGFSIELPDSWETASGEKALEPEDIERVTADNPNLKQFFEGLSDPTSPFKLVSIDPDMEGQFSTNMNVVVTEAPEGLAVEDVEQAALKEVNTLKPLGEVEHDVIDHPAGDAIRFAYDAKVKTGDQYVTLSFLQYSVMGNGKLHTLTFTTLPKLEGRYADDFERSAESFRLTD